MVYRCERQLVPSLSVLVFVSFPRTKVFYFGLDGYGICFDGGRGVRGREPVLLYMLTFTKYFLLRCPSHIIRASRTPSPPPHPHPPPNPWQLLLY